MEIATIDKSIIGETAGKSLDWQSFRTHLSEFDLIDQSDIHYAYQLAQSAHKDQKRGSGEPYFTHPLAVSLILLEVGKR